MSEVIDETPQQELITDSTTNDTTTNSTTEEPTTTQSSSEISLWAHETPFLNQTDTMMTDLKDDDDAVQFQFDQIPAKIREAEKEYDKCNYDASTALLVKCMQLYDQQYGEKWFHKALEEDRPLIELPNINELLEFARLIKEYALNMILLAKYHDSLSSKKEIVGDETNTGPIDDEDNNNSDSNDEFDNGNNSQDSDNDEFDGLSDDECDEPENKDTFFNFATENLQMAWQILGRYVIERSYVPTGDDATNPDKEIMAIRIIKDDDGNEQKLQYALGNPSKRDVPASDLLPLLWRKDPSISIRDIEICQIYLGDIYDAFSDVHIEEEQWEDAARYLELSLRLRKRTEKSYGRGLASIHTKYASYYALRHQYEDSNKHFVLAASVFAHRTLDKINWLYRNLGQHYKLNEKCPKEQYIPNIIIANDSNDDSVLMTQENIALIRTFCNEQLIPTVKTIFGGNITEPNVKEAVNNITDYFQIIDSIMDLYNDNMVDIEEGKNQQGLSISEQSSTTRIDETQRVKKMVDEVWRTDSLLNEATDFNEALGFKKLNKTGDLQSTLKENQINPLNQQVVLTDVPSISTTTTTNVDINAQLGDEKIAHHVPVVKRKNKGPAPGEDVEKKSRSSL